MNVKVLTGILTGTLLLAASGVARADEKLSALDRMFMMKASQGNLSEIQSSRLALKKSSNKKVRMIATMLIKDHGVAEKDLKSVAQLHHVSIPNSPDAKHKAIYQQLTSLSGDAFDKMYMGTQVKDHDATVALFNKEMKSGNETHVHSFAAKYLPGIESHTEMIHNVASNLGISDVAPKKSAMGRM